MLFENSIQACASASPNNTFTCLRSASESDILAAINASLAIEPYPFRPVLDGPGGLLSDYPAKRLSRGAGGRVPLMIGTVLDEGLSVLNQLTVQGSYRHSDSIRSAGYSDSRYLDFPERKYYPVSTWRRCLENRGRQSDLTLSRRSQRGFAVWHG